MGELDQSRTPRQQAQVAEMAAAGQALAVRWGHPPWSDSWSQQVAETLLGAAERARCVACGNSMDVGDHYECVTGEPRPKS